MRLQVNVLAAVCIVFVLAAGCATAPMKPVAGYTQARGDKAAKTAIAMIGRPYKPKGDSPEGFDCSGLVQYSYLSAGVDVPHGTSGLRSVTSKVTTTAMHLGDLLFFDENGGRYSHVGMYIGSGYFVHAPSSGKKVRRDSLQDPYWKKSFLEARRFPVQ